MPRTKNPSKYLYAKTLLSSKLTINQVRRKLLEIFGEGISPNLLIEMKKEIEEEEKQKKIIKPSGKSSFFGGRSISKEESLFFNNLMEKLDSLISSQGTMNKFFFDRFDSGTNKLLSSIEDMEVAFNDSQLTHILNLQKQIFSYVEEDDKSLPEIQKYFNISSKLANYLLNTLIKDGKLEDYYEDKKKYYTLHQISDKVNYSSEFIEEGFFMQREKVLHFLESKPQKIEDIKKEFNFSSEFTRLLLYDMFLKKQIKVLNSTGKRRIALQIDDEYDSKPDDLKVEEIEDEILFFLCQRYGQIHKFTEKYIIPPTKIIYALNQIGELWPEISVKYQSNNFENNYMENRKYLSDDESDFQNFSEISSFNPNSFDDLD